MRAPSLARLGRSITFYVKVTLPCRNAAVERSIAADLHARGRAVSARWPFLDKSAGETTDKMLNMFPPTLPIGIACV